MAEVAAPVAAPEVVDWAVSRRRVAELVVVD